ncbi:Uncharacterised protein [Mycobacteroides abscessus subsp. abscessus]|nr:Uncharacterised protein [Mycobacteroides abscessus subsp. abscessus]
MNCAIRCPSYWRTFSTVGLPNGLRGSVGYLPVSSDLTSIAALAAGSESFTACPSTEQALSKISAASALVIAARFPGRMPAITFFAPSGAA